METMDLTAIVLALITMVSGWVSWYLDRRKHKQEVKGLQADNRMKDMELGQLYVEQFEKNIAEPLRRDVIALRAEVENLKKELSDVKTNACYCAGCPNRISVL